VLELTEIARVARCHDQKATVLWQLVEEGLLNEAAPAHQMLAPVIVLGV
jgi:hypothetical protein